MSTDEHRRRSSANERLLVRLVVTLVVPVPGVVLCIVLSVLGVDPGVVAIVWAVWMLLVIGLVVDLVRRAVKEYRRRGGSWR